VWVDSSNIFRIDSGSDASTAIVLNGIGAGNVGIGTTSPTSILALGGTAARTIQMERNTTAATAGQGLTLSSGGAIAGTADLAGGDLNLKSGISTGTGTSALRFFTATEGTTGTTDRTPTEKMTILGNGNIGVGITNPTAKLQVRNTSMTSGVGGIYVAVTQTQPNTTDTQDSALSLTYNLTAASASNELVSRVFALSSVNSLTGGGILENQRTFNLAQNTSASTTTTNLSAIYIENGSASGTVTNGYGVNIASLQGTNKWGIYDNSGGNWYTVGKVGIGVSSPTALLHLKAGTASANTAPLKFTSGALLSTPEAGTLQYLTDTFYITGTDKLNVASTSTLPTIQGTTGTGGDLSLRGNGANLTTGRVKVLTQTASTSSGTGAFTVAGGVGITGSLYMGGTIAQVIGLDRNATAATAGLGLTISGGGAIAGTADLAGGDLNLKSGISIGTGTSALRFFTATAGTTGTTDNTPTEKMTILGNGNVGIGIPSPADKLDIINGSGVGSFLDGAVRIRTGDGQWVWRLAAKSDSSGYTRFAIEIPSNQSGGVYEALTIGAQSNYSKNIGIGVTNPTNILSINGTAARTIWMERNTTAATSGQGLTLSSGGAIAGTSNLAGGDLTLKSGISTGTASSFIRFFTATPNLSGTADNTPTEKMVISGNGYVAIGNNIGTSGAVSILEITSSDLGITNAGPIITLGRNNNAGLNGTGAGSINFLNKGGTAGFVWQDAAGNMRINTSAPSNANDTAGTVIGAQTSIRDTKQDIEDYTDYSGALSMVTNAPLHTFRYIKEVEGYGPDSPLAKSRIGFIADEVDPAFMVGNVIDQVSVNGILMASIKEMDLKIVDINNFEKENTWRDSLISWFSNASNRITRIFTGEVCLTEAGQEAVCLNRTELQSLKAMLNQQSQNQSASAGSAGTGSTGGTSSGDVVDTTAPDATLPDTSNEIVPDAPAEDPVVPAEDPIVPAEVPQEVAPIAPVE
jgi:hypothetical protein